MKQLLFIVMIEIGFLAAIQSHQMGRMMEDMICSGDTIQLELQVAELQVSHGMA